MNQSYIPTISPLAGNNDKILQMLESGFPTRVNNAPQHSSSLHTVTRDDVNRFVRALHPVKPANFKKSEAEILRDYAPFGLYAIQLAEQLDYDQYVRSVHQARAALHAFMLTTRFLRKVDDLIEEHGEKETECFVSRLCEALSYEIAGFEVQASFYDGEPLDCFGFTLPLDAFYLMHLKQSLHGAWNGVHSVGTQSFRETDRELMYSESRNDYVVTFNIVTEEQPLLLCVGRKWGKESGCAPLALKDKLSILQLFCDGLANLHMLDVVTKVTNGKWCREIESQLSSLWFAAVDHSEKERVAVCEYCGAPFITDDLKQDKDGSFHNKFCSSKCGSRSRSATRYRKKKMGAK